MTSSVHFKNCLGVFEGGGVRGAALAGAYQAAAAGGVRFGAVAGTSAGAIIAAMIAAGASPERVYTDLKATQFRDLLGPPNRTRPVFSRRPPFGWLARLGRRTGLFPRLMSALSVVFESGIYGTDPLQDWLDKLLRNATGLDRPVMFQDLDIPLFIVAADLRWRRPKVWGPTDSKTTVAFAVRCSASIPLFFQAQVDGDGVYVDGGLLANLPSYIFAQPEVREILQTRISRVLAFRLTSAWEGAWRDLGQPGNVKDLLAALADTVVSGATSIQLSLQTDLQTVEIPTGSVKSTDFEGITSAHIDALHTSGRKTTEHFLHEARLGVGVVGPRSHRGFEEFLLLLGQGLRRGYSSLTILAKKTRFIHYQFPAFLFATLDGLEITIVVEPTSDPGENHCRKLLEGLGAFVVEAVTLPWEGFLFGGGTEDRLAAVLAATPAKDYFQDVLICSYQDPLDGPVLSMLEDSVERFVSSRTIATAGGIEIEPFAESKLFDLLRAVRHYSSKAATSIGIERVPLQGIKVLDRYVKEYRLLSVETLMDEFRNRRIDLFEPKVVVLKTGHQTVIAPPVFERAGNEFVIIEGVTRCYLALGEGATSVSGIVVDNVNGNMCGNPHLLKRVRTTSRTMSIAENIDGLVYGELRNVEEVLHPIGFVK